MEFLTQYNLTGIVIGAATFLLIGLFHPLVIKGEYYFGVRCWWVFLLMGIAATAASVVVRPILWSTLLAVWGAKRVRKGWFPKRPESEKRPGAGRKRN